MAQSMKATTQTDDDDSTERMTDVETTTALMATNSAEELRRLAAHIPEASRPRGARKQETAEVIVESAPEFARDVARGGAYQVKCGCGLDVRVGHPQTALREARAHKSRNVTHFPKAVDLETQTNIYG